MERPRYFPRLPAQTAPVKRLEQEGTQMVCVVEDGVGEYRIPCSPTEAARIRPGDAIVYEQTGEQYGTFLRTARAAESDKGRDYAPGAD